MNITGELNNIRFQDVSNYFCGMVWKFSASSKNGTYDKIKGFGDFFFGTLSHKDIYLSVFGLFWTRIRWLNGWHPRICICLHLDFFLYGWICNVDNSLTFLSRLFQCSVNFLWFSFSYPTPFQNFWFSQSEH